MTEKHENYFTEALHNAKIRQLIDTYSKNGFTIQESPQIERERFDLVLYNKETDRTIAFEVKMLPLSDDERASIARLQENAARLGYEFRLVTISRPRRPSIDIEWLDSALLNYLVENPISDLDELSTHTQYEDVEATIEALHVTGENATATVHGTIDVELQYGSNSDLTNDIGYTTSYSVPFEGEVDLDLSTHTVNAAELRVDLSEWMGIEEE